MDQADQVDAVKDKDKAEDATDQVVEAWADRSKEGMVAREVALALAMARRMDL